MLNPVVLRAAVAAMRVMVFALGNERNNVRPEPSRVNPRFGLPLRSISWPVLAGVFRATIAGDDWSPGSFPRPRPRPRISKVEDEDDHDE